MTKFTEVTAEERSAMKEHAKAFEDSDNPDMKMMALAIKRMTLDHFRLQQENQRLVKATEQFGSVTSVIGNPEATKDFQHGSRGAVDDKEK